MSEELIKIQENYARVLDRINLAASKARRNVSDISLVAVSKKVSPEKMVFLASLGHKLFGENYVSEALLKLNFLKKMPAWQGCSMHMIGHLQSNKSKIATEIFNCIQTVDRKSLVTALDKYAFERHSKCDILVQVNISGESSKSGVDINKSEQLIENIILCKNLNLRGLMCIGSPLGGSSMKIQIKEFELMNLLKNNIESKFKINLPELSMGMSDDFELAIEHGATVIRVGSAIFGERAS